LDVRVCGCAAGRRPLGVDRAAPALRSGARAFHDRYGRRRDERRRPSGRQSAGGGVERRFCGRRWSASHECAWHADAGRHDGARGDVWDSPSRSSAYARRTIPTADGDNESRAAVTRSARRAGAGRATDNVLDRAADGGTWLYLVRGYLVVFLSLLGSAALLWCGVGWPHLVGWGHG